jgi:hypothetical protein
MAGPFRVWLNLSRARTATLFHDTEDMMRKMIFMAVAGFIWKKFMAKRTYNGTVPGRF